MEFKCISVLSKDTFTEELSDSEDEVKQKHDKDNGMCYYKMQCIII